VFDEVITYNANGSRGAEFTLSSPRIVMAATTASTSVTDLVFFAGGFTDNEGVSNSVDQFNCNGYALAIARITL
jgi:hypothetical protein